MNLPENPSESFRKRNPEWYPQDRGALPDPSPERNQKTALVSAASGKKEGMVRARVRFTGYRVRPLDPDGFAGSVKDLLDGLVHAGLIPGDSIWEIVLETQQFRVRHFREERTEIEIA